MKKYQVLLFDVDGTLLDFDKAEKIGIERVLTHFGVPATEENMQKYHHLNKSYWQKLERGELTREQVLSLRFEDFFSGNLCFRGVRIPEAAAGVLRLLL